MVTPEFLSYELDYLKTHKALQESILRDMTRRMLKTDIITVSDTSAWQAEKAQQCGVLYGELLQEIAQRTKGTTGEIGKLYSDMQTEVFNYDDELIISSGQSPERVKSISPEMKQTVNAALKKTSTEAKNLTKTTAVTTQLLYHQSCDLAHMQVASGAFTYQQAIKNAIVFAAKQGATVIYPSGHKSSLDVAIRRSVLTGVNQTAGQLTAMRAAELECDLMEITAHAGARPEHADWQGEIVSLSGARGYLSTGDIGYGDVTGFMGANCRHNWYMYFGGARAYTPDELDEFKNHTVEYDGKVYTDYEDTAAYAQHGIQHKANKNTACHA